MNDHEHSIDKLDLEETKKNLQAEKERILAVLKRQADKTDRKYDFKSKFPEIGTKEDENANEVAIYEGRLAEEQKLEFTLKNIDKALELIESGEYGICKNCGKPIDPERLKAFPEARLCIDCARKREK